MGKLIDIFFEWARGGRRWPLLGILTVPFIFKFTQEYFQLTFRAATTHWSFLVSSGIVLFLSGVTYCIVSRNRTKERPLVGYLLVLLGVGLVASAASQVRPVPLPSDRLVVSIARFSPVAAGARDDADNLSHLMEQSLREKQQAGVPIEVKRLTSEVIGQDEAARRTAAVDLAMSRENGAHVILWGDVRKDESELYVEPRLTVARPLGKELPDERSLGRFTSEGPSHIKFKRRVTTEIADTVSFVVGLARFNAGLWDEAAGIFAQADSPPNRLYHAMTLIAQYIDHFRKTGDFKSKLATLQEAEAELLVVNNTLIDTNTLNLAGLSLLKLGDVRRMQSDWRGALKYYEAAEAVAVKDRDSAQETAARIGQAKAENSSHQSVAALGHIERAIELAKRVNDKNNLFEALSIKGEILIQQGNLAAAADSLNRALDLASQVAEEKLFYPYLDRGDVYEKLAGKCDSQKDINVCQKQIELARADYERARSIAQTRGWTGLQKLTDSFITGLAAKEIMLQSQGRVGAVVEQMNVFNPKRAGDVLISEQFAIINLDVPESLAPIYEEVQRFEKHAGGFADSGAARMAHTDGLMRQGRGDLDGALSAFMKAVDLVEKDRGNLSDERTRGKFLEDKISFYHAPALVYLEQKRPDEAFSLLERSKSRAMADLLASRALTLAGTEERDLYAATIALKAKIAKQQDEQFKLIASAGKREEISARGAEIQALEDQYRTLLGRLTKQSPKAQQLIVAPSVTLDQLQRAMRVERFEVLQFLVQDTGVIVWHVSADSTHVRNVFLPRRELIKKITALQASLADRHAKFDAAVAKELFLFLIQPMLPRIKSDRLVIIPHDELHVLSFQALLNPADGRFLGEQFQLSYAPSATVLLNLKRAASIAKGNLLAIADPDIEAAPQEVAAIAALYPKRSQVIDEFLPQEAEIKTLVAGYEVVHLSVHGKFDASEPLFSYLKLSAGEKDDGKLTAAEMFALPLQKAQLVVVSACETGKAEVTRGDEVIGLTRALLYAGAGSLVLSHWEVDSESTALWMQTFYREAQLKSFADAARIALRTVKSKAEFSHPYYWAAFTLITR